ncbi:MAG: ATP-binding protein [bacterium]
MISSRYKRFFVILLSTISIFLFSWFGLLLQKKQQFVGFGINKVLIFFFINLNIIFLTILLYLIIRQSVKLIVERKKKVPGSLFKKNLLYSFIIFSVIPTVFVFFIASRLITKNIDSWFDARIGFGIRNSLHLHEIQTKEQRDNIKNCGNGLFNYFVDNTSLDSVEKIPMFKNFQIYEWKKVGQKNYGSLSAEVNVWRSYRKTTDRSTKSLRKYFFKKITNLKDGQEKVFDFFGSLYWVKSFKDDYLILVHRYPPVIRDSLIEIQNSYYDYQELKVLHNPIIWSYLITFILITLLILFLSLWSAFYLAKGISKPIQDLLAAIEKIRKGELDVKVSCDPGNDLKSLFYGFNEMTTALKDVHGKLESKNKEMSAILENIKAAVFFVNKFGRILTYNNASKDLVQKYLELNRFKNKKINFFGPQIQKVFWELSRELIKSGKNQLSKEISFVFQTEPKTFMVYLTFIENYYQFSQRGLLVVLEDLTDIVKANKIKTWQEAAKQIAHEIKNPLTPIQLATQRLQRKLKKEQKEDLTSIECTDTILNHVKIIKDLVSHFSNLSSMPASNLESVDINKLIKETTVLYEMSYPNFEITYNLEEYLPLIKLDRKKIKRVLVNLIDNSVRAANELIVKDQTNIQKYKPAIQLKTSFKKGLNYIELLVSDNGPGIPRDVRDKLFLPYVSGSKKNMGLGLAIVHDIIIQLNGKIKLIQTNHGAAFQILLPV